MSDKHLLIVDDSKVSRMMIKTFIKARYPDWILFEAESSLDAIELCQDQKIDFFSVDLNMPGKSGLELIEDLQKKFYSAKFALLTANIQKSTHDKAAALGITCINKPINENTISQMLRYFDE